MLAMVDYPSPSPSAAAHADDELEFRSCADDAWYSVRVVLDRRAESLTVRYCNFPDDSDSVFEVGKFRSLEELEDFASRFRPVSVQLQDGECRHAVEGIQVCASHAFTDRDVKFYDAVVEQVKHEEHSFENGEEECLCSFMLAWHHGPNTGLLTEKKIENICVVQSSVNLDPNVASFIKMAREEIETSALKSSSVSDAIVTNCSNVVCHKESGSLTVNEESFVKSLKQGTKCPKRSALDISPCEGRISNLSNRNRQDEDVGGVGNYYTILLENVEKELSPSTIIEFIHQQTSITVQAYVIPSLPSECCTRGVIVLGFQKDLEDLLDFLNYPDHFIVSSRGRPWVVAKNFSRPDIFRASIGTPMFAASQRKLQNGNCRIVDELKVVRSGTEEYKTAKELRDILVEFTTHQERLHKRLAFEERKILHTH
ncbi:hypothetical protein ACOSQ4_002983 [Xanthoceras sorbifolium]